MALFIQTKFSSESLRIIPEMNVVAVDLYSTKKITTENKIGLSKIFQELYTLMLFSEWKGRTLSNKKAAWHGEVVLIKWPLAIFPYKKYSIIKHRSTK